MMYDLEALRKEYPNVARVFEGIPKNAWYIFMPAKSEGLLQLELALVNFQSRESVRERVMALQKLCGFSLRPNQPLHEAQAKAQLQGRKNDALYRDYRNHRNHSDNPPY